MVGTRQFVSRKERGQNEKRKIYTHILKNVIEGQICINGERCYLVKCNGCNWCNNVPILVAAVAVFMLITLVDAAYT